MPVTVLSALRANEFNWNGEVGLFVGRASAVTGSKINAIGNSWEGIALDVDGVVNLTTGTVRSNGNTGMMIETHAAITITGFSVMDNGRGAAPLFDLNGMNLVSDGYAININSSNITGNGKSGIVANMGGNVLTLRSSSWMGNNMSGGDYDPNLLWTGSLVVIR
jgi:hypothetical protein